MVIKKNIYLICNGTSTNDVIRSINNTLKTPIINNSSNKQNLLTYLFSQKTNNKINNQKKQIITNLKEYNINKLFNIGIKELLISQDNIINKNILSKFKHIYTAMDFPSIESAFILYQSLKDKSIFPLPYTSKDLKIKNYTNLHDFKSYYGNYILKEKKTTVNKYWNVKLSLYNYNDDIKNIKKINTTLNWKYCNTLNDNTNRHLFTYNFKKFEKLLINICNTDKSNDILLITNPTIINDILKKVKPVKFNSKKNIIENTSIWKIEIEVNDDSIKYNIFNKIYPTPYNYKPLTLKTKNLNDTYEYTYKNNKFMLFNSIQPIPLNYLKKISYNSFMTINKNIMKQIIIKNNNTDDDIKENNTISLNTFK